MNMATIRKGDILRIKPEWQDRGDDQYTWIAAEDQAKDGSVTVYRREDVAKCAIVPTMRLEAIHIDSAYPAK